MQMQEKPLLLEGYHPVALLKSAVALKHLVSDISELRIREGHVLVVYLALLGRFGKAVQPRHALSELVGKENYEEQGYEEDKYDYQYEHGIGPQGLLHIILERKGHPHYISAVGLCIIEIVYPDSVRLPYRAALLFLYGYLHFRTRPVIVQGGLVLDGIIDDHAVLVDDSDPELRREELDRGSIVVGQRDYVCIA